MRTVPAVLRSSSPSLPIGPAGTVAAYILLTSAVGWAYLRVDPTVFAAVTIPALRWLLVGFAVMGTALVATITAATVGRLYLAVRGAA